MIRGGSGGFSYEVSDEQIAAYRALSIERRVRWVEEHARMTYGLATAEVRERWGLLRRGLPPEGARWGTTTRDPIYVATASIDGRPARIEITESIGEALFPLSDLDSFPRPSAPRRMIAWIWGKDGGPDALDREQLTLEDPGELARGLRARRRWERLDDPLLRRDAQISAERLADLCEKAAEIAFTLE